MVDLSELEAANAIWEAEVLGRPQKLIAYVRSGRPLTAMERAYVADCLKGGIKRKRGRPRDVTRVFCLGQLTFLVQQRTAELRDGGRRYRFHNEAVEYALERYSAAGYPAVPRETLENYLHRSKRRKK
jgi:hypothetical protein